MPTQRDNNPFPYSDSNKRYYTYDYFLRQKFGAKCAKLPIDAGFSCPNRDGTKGIGGCIYCSAHGSGDFCGGAEQTVTEQLESAYAMMSKKWQDPLGIAYFQAFTNTYAPIDELREKYEAALRFPNVVGLSIATRADCIADDVCEYFAELAERTFLTVELGLQTAHDSTAQFINRGHTFSDFMLGYEKLRTASDKINIGVHLIDGLPNESADMMIESARVVASIRPDQLKLHLLHVIDGTRLAEIYRDGEFECLTLDEYADIVVRQLELMPPETVIGRVTGDGAPDTLIAPLWSLKKLVVMNTIDKLMYTRNTWQGRLF
ncbi:MAG: TIGR01212 family radical SAM protein [Clostridiales bacterium]|nr:TIGR01212 family radical SAM protein [Clostridiales bacterium]